MAYKIFLFISMLMCTSCTNKLILPITYNNDIKLSIKVVPDTISDVVKLAVSVDNYSPNDFYFLNKKFVSFSQGRTSLWNLNIYFHDTIPMTTSILINVGIVSKKDYILLKSGDNFSFNYNLDFRTLTREDLSKLGNENDDYGDYTLQLAYADPYSINKQAFRGIIKSNEIKITYKRQ